MAATAGLWSYCLTENKQLFKKTEVCFYDCTARELLFKARAQGDFSKTIFRVVDKDGYSYCPYCIRIVGFTFGQQLVECPVCGKWFKGPRREFPIDYECVECE